MFREAKRREIRGTKVTLPDFLCIGAQKAGTTWLYLNIRQHPDVWMPPVKEIHYFNSSPLLPMIAQICNPKSRRVRRRLILELLRIGKPEKMRHIRWYARYFFQPCTDAWYESLFLPSKGQVSGDVTPAYARLEESVVARVHALLPKVKVIYILRNPIQRIWSQAAMHFKWKYHNLGAAKDEQIRKFINRRGGRRNSDYMRTLRTWGDLYPERQMHIGFFDHLTEDPRGFLESIYNFLGLDSSDQFIPKTIYERRNAGRYPAIPDQLVRYLASRYYEQIEQLHTRFHNRYTASWLDFAEQHL
jgi:hypothetical protein